MWYKHSSVSKFKGGFSKATANVVARMSDYMLFMNMDRITFSYANHRWIITHWGRATHICVSKLTIIGSDNGLSPGRGQVIIWTNDGILLIRTFRTHFSEIVSEIHTFSFTKTHFKMSSGKWRPSCLGLNVIMEKETHEGVLEMSKFWNCLFQTT